MEGLQKLLALEDIRQLAVRYSHYRDGLHLDKLADLFHEDGVCDMGPRFGGKREGRKAIRAHFEGSKTIGGGVPFGTVHTISTHDIAFFSPVRAQGRCFLVDYITQEEANPMKLVVAYDDEYTSVDGVWKFSRRTLEMLWPHNDGTARLAENP